MKKYMATLAVMTLLATPAFCGKEGYTLLYQARSKKSLSLGPTGIWGYGPGASKTGDNPNFFVVNRAEVGSPSHGMIREFDIITGVNGKPFSDASDPRLDLAFAIEDAEAKDGELHLDVNRGGKAIIVTINLDKIPAYSPTWPFNCERTETILINAAEFLKREQMPEGDIVADDGSIGPLMGGLFWLAMGEPRYMQNACRMAYLFKERLEAGKTGNCWTLGYTGLLFAEYYNMTGDRGILPAMENVCSKLAKSQMPSGGWSHGQYTGVHRLRV